MASVSKDPSGRFRVQFVAPDGARKTVRLPTGDRKAAEAIARHVDALLAARLAGLPVPRETAVWLADLPELLRQRLATAGLIDPGPGAMTLGQWCSDYLARQTHTKPASRLAVEQAIRNLIEFFGAERTLASVTAGDAHDFRKWLLAEGRSQRQRRQPKALSQATVAKRLRRCSAIFLDAKRRKLLDVNPFDGVRVADTPNRQRQVYVSAEVIERAIEATPDPERKLLLAMARYLGLRVPSEPFSMTWDCVDWAAGRLKVPSPKTETHGKPWRAVPLVAPVRRHLEVVFEAAPEGSNYIFERLRQRDSMRMAAKGFWASLNLRQWLLHLLRRLGIPPGRGCSTACGHPHRRT